MEGMEETRDRGMGGRQVDGGKGILQHRGNDGSADPEGLGLSVAAWVK